MSIPGLRLPLFQAAGGARPFPMPVPRAVWPVDGMADRNALAVRVQAKGSRSFERQLPGCDDDGHVPSTAAGRFGRLAEAVARFPKMIGIGLAEDTGLVIKNCNEAEVIGSGMVILFDPRKLKHNNQKVVVEGSPMSLTNLKTHILANGDKLDIKKKKIKISPLHIQMKDAEAL